MFMTDGPTSQADVAPLNTWQVTVTDGNAVVGDITTGCKPARRGRVNPISSSFVSEVHEDRR